MAVQANLAKVLLVNLFVFIMCRVTQAVEVVNKAVEHDQAGSKETALLLYHEAISYFDTGLRCAFWRMCYQSVLATKYMKKAEAKAQVQEKIAQYVGRVEELRRLVAISKAPPPAAGGFLSFWYFTCCSQCHQNARRLLLTLTFKDASNNY